MRPESERDGTSTVLVAFMLIMLAAPLWPSRYETYLLNGHTYRRHRFSGKREILTPAGWLPAAADAPKRTQRLPPDELEKLDRRLDFHSAQHTIWTEFHNRTAWKIYGINVEVRLKDGTSRRYALEYADGAAPSESGIFYADADIDESEVAAAHLESAAGRPPGVSR